jgi:hypothetical protein
MWPEQVRTFVFECVDADDLCLASLAGRKHEELAEMIDESKVNNDSSKLPLMERAKIYIYKTL